MCLNDYMEIIDELVYCDECGNISYSDCAAETGSGCHVCSCIACNDSCDVSIANDDLSTDELGVLKREMGLV